MRMESCGSPGPRACGDKRATSAFRKVAELPEGKRGQDVHALTIDLAGNPWISVVRSSLFRYRNGTWERNGNLPALPDQRPQVHALDHEGRLWFGYRDGTLAVVESDQVQTTWRRGRPGLRRNLCAARRTHTRRRQ